MFLYFISFFLFFFITYSQTQSPLSQPLSPPPSPNSNFNRQISPTKTTLVIVGALTTIFSITFLLLLYVKHCKRDNLNTYTSSNRPLSPGYKKNSGVDRMVIESLPVFRFGSLRGQKQGLECAVCLNKFEPTEFLKLLPKCNHAFHVQCVDTWLEAHSTCPLCRYRVHPEDILLVHHHGGEHIFDNYNSVDENQDEEMEKTRRVSGRHSSAGERGKKSIQIVVENSDLNRSSLDSLRSLGFLKKKKKIEEEKLSGRRKDGLLLTAEKNAEELSCFERRFSHRIIVSDAESGGAHSDDPSDLFYLRSEMIVSDSRRFSGVQGGV